MFFAAFWSAKSGAKTDPPTKKAKRRGLTLAPGDYSRVCKQTVPSARAFSPHLFERLFCQAGFIRRHSGGKDASGTSKKHRSLRSPLEAVLNRRIIVRSGKKEHSPARVPGAGGCKGLILLRPLNAGRRRLPRRTTCGWFWCYLLPSKGSYAPRAKTAALLLFAAKKYKSTPRLPQKRRLPKKPPENTQYYLIYGVVRNCIAASRSRGWRVPCRSTCPCANRRGTRRPPCSAG